MESRVRLERGSKAALEGRKDGDRKCLQKDGNRKKENRRLVGVEM